MQTKNFRLYALFAGVVIFQSACGAMNSKNGSRSAPSTLGSDDADAKGSSSAGLLGCTSEAAAAQTQVTDIADGSLSLCTLIAETQADFLLVTPITADCSSCLTAANQADVAVNHYEGTADIHQVVVIYGEMDHAAASALVKQVAPHASWVKDANGKVAAKYASHDSNIASQIGRAHV